MHRFGCRRYAPTKEAQVTRGLLTSLSCGRTDWATKLGEDGIPWRKFSRQKGDDEKVRRAWRFIFHHDVAQLLAWGSIGLKRGCDCKILPGIMPKMCNDQKGCSYLESSYQLDGDDQDIYG